MSDAISVECPQCGAKLKLKNRSAAGKKIPCPKCKKPFVVELPADDDEFAALVEADEFAAAADDDAEEPSRLPPARTGRPTSKKAPKKRRAGSGNWKKPALIGGGVIAVLAILGGVGFVVAPLIGDLLSRNKIDTAWLPPDAEVFVHVRVADSWNSPIGKSLTAIPAVQQGLRTLKQSLGLDPEEIRSLTVGATTPDRAAVVQPGPAAGFGLNPAFAGMPTLPGAGGFGHAITVVRMLQPFDSKAMQTKLQSTRTNPYQSYELVYPGGPILTGSVCFIPDTSTLVFGAEADVKAAIDRGAKGARCQELDFIDASQHVVIVGAPKNPAALRTNSAPLGAPVGAPAPPGADLSKMMDAHAVGVCLGLNFTDDVEVSVVAKCETAAGAKDIAAELEKQLQEGKSQINTLLSAAPPQLASLVTAASTILNSITIQANGNAVIAKGKVPGSIKSTIESSLPTLMMAGAMGGLPGANFQPGGFQPGGVPPGTVPQNSFPPSSGVGGFGLPNAGGPERTEPNPTAPGQVNSADAILSPQEAARRTQCKNNLKQIGLAMHTSHDARGSFPGSALRDKSGKPLLSWRVALLPYLDQDKLYKEFHLDEPWDSEHNQKLIPRMPALFACPDGKAAPGMTSYLAVTGPGAVFEAGDPRKFAEITDGTSNTILVVEADDSLAVTWTKPDDYAYDPANPIKGLVGHHPGGFLALTCDGAAYFVAETLDPRLLVALFTRSGGESIPPGVLK